MLLAYSLLGMLWASSWILDQPTTEFSRCSEDNRTYNIYITGHVQKELGEVIDAIMKNNNFPDEDDNNSLDNDAPDQYAGSVKSYLSSVVTELNNDLLKFGVQIRLITPLHDLYLPSISDPSCEISSPVNGRTVDLFSLLENTHHESIGVHLGLFSCPYLKDIYERGDIVRNQKCGRVIGVLWSGNNDTKDLIKGQIIEAFTDEPGAYQNGRLELQRPEALCEYLGSCIGLKKSHLGFIEQSIQHIRYNRTDDVSTDYDDDYYNE